MNSLSELEGLDRRTFCTRVPKGLLLALFERNAKKENHADSLIYISSTS